MSLLRKMYGRPQPPPTRDPFELILLENVAYLATPARRREAFGLLKKTVGTTPQALLAAPASALAASASAGILPAASVAKLRECARVALEVGDLRAVVALPRAEAVKKLRAFPGIGEPGAEKVLLLSGRHALLAPDSNGLRVLARLGLLREEKSYARTYANSRAVAAQLPATPAAHREAHLLLQLHGQTLCKRSAPLCHTCVLNPRCPHAAGGR